MIHVKLPTIREEKGSRGTDQQLSNGIDVLHRRGAVEVRQPHELGSFSHNKFPTNQSPSQSSAQKKGYPATPRV
jgi:hypothetical protein